MLMKKPNPHSRLKNLPPERQEEIYEHVSAHSCAETCEWLRTQGVQTNPNSVREFYHWYRLGERLESASSTAERVCEALRGEGKLDVDEEGMAKVGQALFETQALLENDPKLYVAMQRVRQGERSLTLRERAAETNDRHKARQLELKDRDLKSREARWTWAVAERIHDVAKDPKTRTIVDNSGLTRAEKIAAIRNAYFADVDAEEVILPP
jgi:hypothetical protein